jgi:Na+/H+ antiporter NhaD/arsenite permease-like protein
VPDVPVEFLLFALTLTGVAVAHHRALEVAVTGLLAIASYKVVASPFDEGAGLSGLGAHFVHEGVTLANLAGLLLGFALLSRHFEESRLPQVLPRWLPGDWRGVFVMLVMVFVLSSFLDNIAAALIGGAMAHSLFRSVHVGYLAAIVAASNAGGSGSVVGDTTTTMMWIQGVSPMAVLHAYVAAGVALVVCGIPAALQQHRHAPMRQLISDRIDIDWGRVAIVMCILVAAILANVIVNTQYPAYAQAFPILAAAVWATLLVTAGFRRPDWKVLPESVKGTVFLLCLVSSASMMPVERLPPPSWQSSFALGLVSAVFDNIPLTALALQQGGYDWGMLAYTVGFGGSMLWFGSSAGVAISTLFPQSRSVVAWVRGGWHVAVAYVVGFFVLLAVLGWQPTPSGPH